MQFHLLKRVLLDFIRDPPAFTLETAIVACLRERLPQDEKILGDTGKMTAITSTAADLLRIVQLSVHALHEDYRIKLTDVFVTRRVRKCDFYRDISPHRSIAQYRAALIEAVEAFLELYADRQSASHHSDTLSINIRKLEAVKWHLTVFAEELI